MVNYQLAKIYQIICNTTGKKYIGATCQKKLCTRLAHHVSKNNKTSSKEIIEGRNYEMVLIESYPCSSKDELHQRERFYIQSMECVNKNIPGRTKQEYMKDHYVENKEQIREKQKDYYDENKVDILKQHKDYYDENKSDILKQRKDHYVNNREQILKQKKDYRLKNREIINKKQREKRQVKKITPEDHRAERREYWQSKKDSINSLSPPE